MRYAEPSSSRVPKKPFDDDSASALALSSLADSAMPSSIAARRAGSSFAASNGLPAPIPIWAKRANIASSDGTTGMNCSRKLRYSIEPMPAAFSSFQRGHTTAGAGAGVGVPANFESGVSVYFVCTACIAAMSDGPFSWVRVSVPTKSVSARKTLVIPFGTSPFQRGPAKR